MKAALVSATSLAALLAFEVGLDVAIDAKPAMANAFTATPTSLFGYVLLNTSALATNATAIETLTNNHVGANTVTFSALTSLGFTGAAASLSLATGAGTGTYTYTLSMAAGTTIGHTTGSVLTTITSGAGTSVKSVLTLAATAVAPEQQTTLGTTTFSNVRIGTTATIAALTVKNIGDGDLYSSTLSAAQLQVSLGVPSNSVFTAYTNTFSLNDTHYSVAGSIATTSATISYLFAPTAHAANQSVTATVSFLNGASNTNSVTTSALTLTGSGVGPAFGSTVTTGINGTAVSSSYSNSTALAGSTTTIGTVTVSAKDAGHTYTDLVSITLQNTSNDDNPALANSTLTELTLESMTLSGAAGFSIVGFSTDTILGEGATDVVYLDYVGSSAGTFTSELTIDTDQGAAFESTSGAVYTYILIADVPEPSTVLTFGMGLAGLGWVRRRRANRAKSERRYGLI